MTTTGRRSPAGLAGVLATAVVAVVVLVGCGDDESAQDRYCDAGESLRSSLGSLVDLDLIAEGTDGLNDAVAQVGDDVDDLRDAASDAAEGEVEALEQTVDDLESAIEALGGELTRDNATAVAAAIGNVGTAAQAVLDTLSDC